VRLPAAAVIVVVGVSVVVLSEWVLLLEGVVVSLVAVALSSPESQFRKNLSPIFDALKPVSVKKIP
jgi:hypothetical protein